MEKSGSSKNLGDVDKSRHHEAELNSNEQATTSKGDNISLTCTCYNMGDLAPMEFNSADAVRQAMKAVLGKGPPPDTENVTELPIQDDTAPQQTTDLAPTPVIPEGKYVQTAVSSKHNVRGTKQPKSKEKKQTSPRKQKLRSSNLKGQRRGPQARSSDKNKKIRSKLSAMFVGKLSDVVSFKHR